MFYSQFILAKKGPLGTIWIAAHLERKLRKNQVADTDIGVSVDSILSPEVPIALRLSSHLLLGVVRIYSRKVNYLFDDCSEALLKVKQAFRSTAVDLPPEESTAPYHSITLPETFDLDDFELPENEIFQGNFVDHHVSTRDQITLQDTMDRMGYSTSQFGLDERFGDGDTSQIGLDLEEELFSDKREASVHEGGPAAALDPSSKPVVPVKGTENIDEIMENSEFIPLDYDRKQIDANAESMNYAQAPCTPGLLEEPNLSSAQEGLACDDHLELEDRSLAEPMAIESREIDFGKSDHRIHSDAMIHSSHNDSNQATVSHVPSDVGQVLDDMEMIEANAGDLPSATVTGEFNFLAHLEKSLGVGLNETIVLPNESDSASKAHEHDYDPGSITTCLPVSKDYSKDDEKSGEPRRQSDIEVAANVEDSRMPDKLSAATGCVIESLSKLEGSDAEASQDPKNLNGAAVADHGETPSFSSHVLQQCHSRLNEAAPSSELGGNSDLTDAPSETSRREDMEGKDLPVTGNMKPTMENYIVEPRSCEVQLSNANSGGQDDNAISSDHHLENPNNSSPSNLPAPEKLLSAPEILSAKPADILVESTPNKEVPEGADGAGAGAGTTQISGRKRSLTESTLTVQSLNSVESFEVNGLKRTAESVPDDDDLLSSILVGRRSSVLKMKPTPPAPEVASLKRPRAAPRPSVSKRKVLMDDTMVLHGDTIRQQLVNTEDIRRLRKKAPCTRPEILLIQRQFLEDEVFNQPIFTGMSGELICLHCKSYDVSRIKVDENVESISSSELGIGMESSIRLNVTEENEKLRSQTITLENSEEVQPIEMPLDVNQQDGKQEMCSHGIGVIGEGPTDQKNWEREMVDRVTGMETEGVSVAIDPDNHTALHGHDSSFTADPICGGTCNMPAGNIDSALTQKTDVDGRLGQMDGPCMSPDRKLDSVINEDTSAIDVINEKAFDSVKRTTNNVDIQAKVGMESRAGDEIVLQENKDGASAKFDTGVLRDSCKSPVENTSLANLTQETGGCDELAFENSNPTADGLGEKVLVDANRDEFDTHLLCQDQSPSTSFRCVQEYNMTSNPVHHHVDVTHDFINNGEYGGLEKGDLQNPVDAESTGVDHLVHEHHHDPENFTIENDTEFLNVDDDEMVEEGDGDMAIDESHFDNSGWSSRTRAVAKYLQVVLEKEALHGTKVLPMDNLLTGKTRKEASRMFFETLVLKTRDYIHVEQAKAFDNINIKPRPKLMKADF